VIFGAKKKGREVETRKGGDRYWWKRLVPKEKSGGDCAIWGRDLSVPKKRARLVPLGKLCFSKGRVGGSGGDKPGSQNLSGSTGRK